MAVREVTRGEILDGESEGSDRSVRCILKVTRSVCAHRYSIGLRRCHSVACS